MLKNEMHNYYTSETPYERFITNHLQHYGYYNASANILSDLKTYGNEFCIEGADESNAVSETGTDDNKNDSLFARTTQVVFKTYEDGRVFYALREPFRQEHALNFYQGPRWPAEMEVLPERVKHVVDATPFREPLYVPNMCELKPQPKGEEYGRLVFHYNPHCSPYFFKSKSSPSSANANVSRVTVDLTSPSDETLIFESRFESGNLEKAYQTGDYEYELYLRPDLYTDKHTQWFYFRVTNTKSKKLYRFTIVNFYKSDSLYNEGLRPLLYSEWESNHSHKGWRRCGTNISYYRNNNKYETSKGQRHYYSLTWTFMFPHDNDTVYFCHCYPYTYSDMMDYVRQIADDKRKRSICQIQSLSHSLADNICPLLTITNRNTDTTIESNKKIIIISARVHPGESNSSWMMEGVLDFLLAETADANLLRDLFVFKVVPMLNPDGVIVGNYRCSLAGRDLNRNYRTQLKTFYPVVCSIRNLIEKLVKKREVLFYCDFHGHSRKQNIFSYGNNNQEDEVDFLMERVFSVLLNKNASDKFDHKSCKYKMQKNKGGTSRIVFRNLGIPHSITIEASFCGSTMLPTASSPSSNAEHFHFNIKDLKMLGEAFCNSLLDFSDPDNSQVNKIMATIKYDLANKYLHKLQNSGIDVETIDLATLKMADIVLAEMESSDDDDDDGSDSSDSNGLPVHLEVRENQSKLSKSNRKRDKCVKDAKEKELNENTCLKLKHEQSNVMKQHLNPKTKFVSNHSDMKEKPLQSKSTDLLDSLEAIHSKHRMLNQEPVLRRPETPKKIQEIEATKVYLRYSGNSAAKNTGSQDYLCQYHDEIKRNSFLHPWKLSGNNAEGGHKGQSVVPSNYSRPKSGISTNTFQVLSFTPQGDMDPRNKNANLFYRNQTHMNKRVHTLSVIRKKPNKVIPEDVKDSKDVIFISTIN